MVKCKKCGVIDDSGKTPRTNSGSCDEHDWQEGDFAVELIDGRMREINDELNELSAKRFHLVKGAEIEQARSRIGKYFFDADSNSFFAPKVLLDSIIPLHAPDRYKGVLIIFDPKNGDFHIYIEHSLRITGAEISKTEFLNAFSSACALFEREIMQSPSNAEAA